MEYVIRLLEMKQFISLSIIGVIYLPITVAIPILYIMSYFY